MASSPASCQWWCLSVESTLTWPSLRPYNLLPDPTAIAAALDPDSDDETSTNPGPTTTIGSPPTHPEHASLRLPPHFRAALSSGGGVGRGALDDRAELTHLVDRFMRLIHAKQPVLDPRTLYDQIAVVAEEGLGWDERTCLLLLACALSLISQPYSPSSLHDYSTPSIPASQYARSREYFAAGRKRLGLAMGRANVVGAQCFFLAAGYYVTVFRPMAAWRCLRAARVMCRDVWVKGSRRRVSTRGSGGMSNGETRDDDAGDDDAPDNSHRTLFWSCLKTEREIAAELAFDFVNIPSIQYYEDPPAPSPPPPPPQPPPSIFSAELEREHRFPPAESAELHQQVPSPSAPEMSTLEGRGLTAEEHEQSWLYYLTDVSLRKLEMEIDIFLRQEQSREQQRQEPQAIEVRESFYRDILATLADLDEQIVGHSARLPASITIETDASGHSPDDLREYLRLRIIIIRHDLSRPALHFMLHGVLDGLSMALRAQAASIANRALAIDEYLVTAGLTTHRHPGTWLGIRYCTRAALELLATSKASSAVPDLLLPPTWERGMTRFKTALTYWSAESRDARIYLDWLIVLGV